MTERPPFSAEEFFATQQMPPRLEEHLKEVGAFVERNVNAGRRIVLVTVSLKGAQGHAGRRFDVACWRVKGSTLPFPFAMVKQIRDD